MKKIKARKSKVKSKIKRVAKQADRLIQPSKTIQHVFSNAQKARIKDGTATLRDQVAHKLVCR